MTETINEYKRLQAMGLDQNELNEWNDGEVQRFRAMGLADEEITNEFGFKVAPRNQQQEYWNEIRYHTSHCHPLLTGNNPLRHHYLLTFHVSMSPSSSI